MPTLKRDDDVYVLDLGDGENRFHPDWLAAVNTALDEVESAPAPLVTTASSKIYSNGLDLDWLGQHGDQLMGYVADVQALLARVLEFPTPTVAAIPGHAFAAGAMLALAHDFRVMRADRGFFCLPEVDINIPFTPGMAALIQSKLVPATAHEAMTTGRRYGGAEAAAEGLVDEAVPEPEVLANAMKRARSLVGKNPETLKAIKAQMYTGPLAALRD
ncbi:enoyl-CoA hydratase-related protein [Actinophytocola algeriensis]|uniref:Enoyl-CoA hydratase/carnithine racemase n=1 Tax=Actinophytocola algeriensis TaxID=1768010 RepID=A0A7W7Q065_9PSEU|nr:enoyl-CoA hydratase-related protein [Actinophytocola algeriensis]MBB4904554.1 enoyl-CoA hydratase/carnithine racemase [Actinophytocola algeriensis]MBE1476587.1 enoyl-CoA hydratase/carnithine racemase [Actinophytocola algeriensis]